MSSLADDDCLGGASGLASRDRDRGGGDRDLRLPLRLEKLRRGEDREEVRCGAAGTGGAAATGAGAGAAKGSNEAADAGALVSPPPPKSNKSTGALTGALATGLGRRELRVRWGGEPDDDTGTPLATSDCDCFKRRAWAR